MGMNSIFSFDNPVWNFIGKLVDMLLLTLVWAVCSLPIVTIGASTSALYYVILKLAEDKEGNIYLSFFRAFRENFKQSTVCWLIMFAFGLVLGGDFYICYQMRERAAAKTLMIVFLILAVLYCMILTYLFPVLARCEADCKKVFFLSFMMSVKQFGWTLFMLAITVSVLALGIFVQWLFLFISVGLIAYLHAVILKHIFDAYGLGLPDTEDGAYEIPY